MTMGTKEVLKVERLQMLSDGGYSNAEEIAHYERDDIEVAAPIKHSAMNSEHFRPVRFIFDEASDTIRCPGGQTLRPSWIHTRNRAIRYRTSACKAWVAVMRRSTITQWLPNCNLCAQFVSLKSHNSLPNYHYRHIKSRRLDLRLVPRRIQT
ncbi:hypothetical protein OEG84_15785 [Hoeflea sp. G2-23]|uniref:Uncharacterized protein n=1 Tax=Hoeflea algicola TaxID=2983763 RepID=A0ABT3ZBF3_9HYPH|nr:hypothetical protein [Hoeflea algicola]MCY0149128.1 hypothetical protein [Hoeflea algicola]